MSDRHSSSNRLTHIDGLRAIAILWVAVYHYAVFWSSAGKGDNLLPYDDALSWIPLADVGALGVYLFFIVSGFVIAMSLTRSTALAHFGINRLIRLWPTLLMCGAITFTATSLLGPDALVRAPVEYMISMTFVPPAHVGKIIGLPDLAWLDGAYWSLWTEVRFYIVAAVLYFAFKSRFLALWALFAAGSAAIHMLGLMQGGVFDALSRLMFAEHQPYFTAGIALAALRFGPFHWGPVVLLGASVGQAFAYPSLTDGGLGLSDCIGLAIVFALAIPTMLARTPVPFLSSPAMVTVGVASYAYYLLHQNTGLALLNAFNVTQPLAAILMMLAIQAGLLCIAIVLTQRIEVPIRQALRQWTQPKRPAVTG